MFFGSNKAENVVWELITIKSFRKKNKKNNC